MSYSTIMVQLDLDHSNDGRLRVAAQLAERFGSAIVGVAAGDIQPLYFVEGGAGETFLENARASLRGHIAEVERTFRQFFKSHSKPVEWRSALAWPLDFAAREARAADLIVTGTHRARVDPLRQADAGGLVLSAGRPVLVVPPEIDHVRFKTVMVAWKDTREARRAISDALPLLHQAESVLVAELVGDDGQRAAAKDHVSDVAAWLVRRGIAAASIATKELISAAGQLDILAQDEGADIIVAGAYGHTRLSEWVFGGVTRDLLRHGKRCALLSH